MRLGEERVYKGQYIEQGTFSKPVLQKAGVRKSSVLLRSIVQVQVLQVQVLQVVRSVELDFVRLLNSFELNSRIEFDCAINRTRFVRVMVLKNAPRCPIYW